MKILYPYQCPCGHSQQKFYKVYYHPVGLRRAWVDYVAGFSQWVSFWSLTFSEADRTHDVTREEALGLWRRLIQSLNRDLYGNHYTRIVGHSYFSYALAFEYQTRGALHLHALVDKRTNWELANRVWRAWAGIVKIKPVDDMQGAARYLAKYVTKGGEVSLYRCGVHKEPAFKPLWYLPQSGKISLISKPEVNSSVVMSVSGFHDQRTIAPDAVQDVLF